ncbi:hypothetical protein NM688_g2380 [Phlebia brevispora]|uniref:Uncharacterized protein n=1 Tax=Phlebia brevispora TaxID=194682 RepID=A0ACC1T947_9APHY|nr:hypothetical protein NM688_g2380 [Phlebia brevispora]
MGVIIRHDRLYDRREETAITTVVATPTLAAASATPTLAVSQPLPTSVKALAGFITVFGLIIIGIVAYKVGKWRRRKIRAASQKIGDYKPKAASMIHVDLIAAAKLAEKPEVVYEPYKWQPQVAVPKPVHSNPKTIGKGSKGLLGFILHPKPTLSTEPSPPPAYSPHPLASPPVITIQAARPDSTVPHLSVEMLNTDPHPSTPLPSPARTKSIAGRAFDDESK